ncbi:MULTISPECIES: peroxiredoxin-like family protein [Nitrospirillum]|uniref:thioredoxin-dependent peroxiredoxin n=1 Tax=Nitrospirillum amazonense TaxID=28077 RepID=A0A560FRI8_9PROT|nr:peroxiredoxin-like family protein [Nitrospirillum amazonense]MEC4591521.1 peroxiredoxin-like family protein [Nitrospirillum amazonense]TWB24244.1 peroxiredoxin [Nitrospirillum amazonense]
MYLTMGLELEEENERAAMSPQLAEVIETTLAHVTTAAPGLGAQAPAFHLVDTDGREVALADFRGRPLVVSFIRGGWCSFCSLELSELEAARAEIEATGAALIAITPERFAQACATRRSNGVGFPVLVDEGMAVARDWGLVFRLPSEWYDLYRADGLDLSEVTGGDGLELPVPATFVLDRNGAVRASFVDANYRRRLDPMLVLHTLEQMQEDQ